MWYGKIKYSELIGSKHFRNQICFTAERIFTTSYKLILCLCVLSVLGGLRPLQVAIQRRRGADPRTDRCHQEADPEVSRPLAIGHHSRW